MRSIIDHMIAVQENPDAFIDADLEFHRVMARASQNEVLAQVLDTLLQLIRQSHPELAKIPGIAPRAVAHHEARAILALGPQSVVVKSGHLPDTDESVDLFFGGREFRRFRARTTRCASARARIAELCS